MSRDVSKGVERLIEKAPGAARHPGSDGTRRPYCSIGPNAAIRGGARRPYRNAWK
jgi:hypothetical protein